MISSPNMLQRNDFQYLDHSPNMLQRNNFHACSNRQRERSEVGSASPVGHVIPPWYHAPMRESMMLATLGILSFYFLVLAIDYLGM